ncbi:cytochrome P450 [Kibdelosporangium banguiense]|uniref:Cytochrome P450 n=1 Tax=Kibdelosporangium banguiense TaxID=1365924 RepID=A0ABS4TPW3_9PSEU|nr:cytochrome P450 [Kibdelosporangium banguiense]MBP2326444.1 cytochrome P450 [Kibdelosporangium banguiense]
MTVVDTAADVVAELLTEEGQENPYPCYARLREIAPVYYSEAFGNYLVTRHDDCDSVLVSSDIGKADAKWADTAIPDWRDRPTSRYLFASMLRLNPPDHSRVRGLVNSAFSERRVATMRPQIESIVDNVLDGLEDAAGNGSVVDFMKVVSYPMTVAIMGDLVGVSARDNERCRDWTGRIARILDPDISAEDLAASDTATTEIQDHFAELIRQRTAAPRNDIVSALIGVRAQDGDRLSVDEMQSTLALLFLAGLDTSALTIGTGVATFLDHPDQIAVLRANPVLSTVTDEVIRWDTAAQVAHRRVLRDTVIGGTPLAEGSTISVMLGAANRDPVRFENPDTFDITRPKPRNLGFGAGAHFCIGSAVARLEGSVFFPKLFQRFPKLAKAGKPVRRNTLAIRGFRQLPVSIT